VADLTDQVRPYVMGDKRLSSAVATGPNHALLLPFLCSFIFCPKRRRKKHFSFLPSFYSNAASSTAFFSPCRAPALEPPFYLWRG